LPFITTWDDSRNRNPQPIDSAEEGEPLAMVPLLEMAENSEV
jgi:hypothetical protein